MIKLHLSQAAKEVVLNIKHPDPDNSSRLAVEMNGRICVSDMRMELLLEQMAKEINELKDTLDEVQDTLVEVQEQRDQED